jgi:hypothetical protein
VSWSEPELEIHSNGVALCDCRQVRKTDKPKRSPKSSAPKKVKTRQSKKSDSQPLPKKGNQQSATRRRKVGSLSFAIGGDSAGAHPLALL